MTLYKLNLTWGDTVIIDSDAPKKFKPSEIGSICGIRMLKNQSESDEFHGYIGSNLYLVEFFSGASLEVPEQFLSKYIDKFHSN